ncbi:MAG: SDR family oxidoreductase [Clostridiales bacterium]|nr:SDR family oxidoreductase [Clostridiales bacterium]
MIRKTVLIIGASSEIGSVVAKKYAEKGYNLALTYNKNKIAEIKSEAEVKTYKLDLSDSQQIKEVFAKLGQDFKSFDSMVFCPAISQKRKLILDVTDEEIDDLFEINIKSAIKCVREFSKITFEKGETAITLIGSFVEKTGCSCESVYTATKSAMSGLCKSLAVELGNFGTRINVVAPGFIDTKMNNNLSTAEKEDMSSATPLQRLGESEDVANAVLFLNSEKASFITGQTIYVDGGLVLQ